MGTEEGSGRTVGSAALVVGMLAGVMLPVSGRVAGAALAPAPAGCPFTLQVPGDFQGAGGSLLIPVTVRRVSEVEACTVTVIASLDIVPTAGGTYSGITDNPSSAPVTLDLEPGRQDPRILLSWSGYCAAPATPATFVVSVGTQTVTTPYAPVVTCATKGFGSSTIGSSVQSTDDVGLVPSPDGRGYTTIDTAADHGGSGDAPAYDQTVTSDAPVVGGAGDPLGGEWMVAADGGVFSLGPAPF